MKLSLSIAGLLFCFQVSVFSQMLSVGTPFIKNYTRSTFKAGQQNWMIDQAPDGRLYFANNEGLLEFDGSNWQLYPLPRDIVVRSVFAADDGKIYVGGYNEFGYFKPDKNGRLTYFSFNDLLEPADQNFDEIWRIHNTPDGLIFQSYKQIIIISENEATVVKAPGIFHFSYFVGGQLYVNDLEKGILRYSMGNFHPLIGTAHLNGLEIWSILPTGNELLIATANKGIFLYDGNTLKEWSNPAAKLLQHNQVFTAKVINDNLFAFGTIRNGLIICTKEGIPLQQFNRAKGLQNNTILNMLKDHAGNLWLATDNGIDYVEINSPLSFLSYADGIGAGYAAKLFNENLYLGTNQGVYFKNWERFLNTGNNEKFQLVENTSGQVWTLQIIEGELFCGSHNGTFIIEGNKARSISEIPGGWTYRQHPEHSDKIIGGTYSGLILFEKLNGKWRQTAKIKGFNESSRILEFEKDGSIWMSHGFKGTYRIFLDSNFDSVARVDFYSQNINVTNVNDQLYFTGKNGLFRFNSNNNTFEKSDFLSGQISWNKLSLLYQDRFENIWLFQNDETGVFRRQEDGTYLLSDIPFKQLKGQLIGGFEFVYPVTENNVLFGVSDGFAYYNASFAKNYQSLLNLYLDRVYLPDLDSAIYFGRGPQVVNPVLKFKNNSISFSFTANDFENTGETVYKTYLEGYEEDWTTWETKHAREFTNLHEGNYTFHIKARNIYGHETEPLAYQFEIAPPRSRSAVAYLIYLFIIISIIVVAIVLLRRKIERSKRKEAILQQKRFKEREDKLQRETLEAEKEIIRLRNEKLREQMTMKDKELANATMEMIQKNKVLNKIKGNLKSISAASQEENLKGQINSLTKRINRELDTEKQWEVFETHFENVHEEFLKRLKNAYPVLSPRELKLCAYLRMNISSKEIAALMNISTRGVEISRYRLRKKLNLNRETNLTDFIITF